MEVRLARLEDADAIRRIYNLEVTTSTATFDLVPRSLAEQQAWLRARLGAHAVVVAVDDLGEVTGFGALSPYRDRPAYRTTVEDSVYVGGDHRGTGVGSLVLGKLLSLAGHHGFHAVMARIAGDHNPSIALHRRHGFVLVGVEREIGRKFNRWLDVTVMQRLL